MSWPENYDYQIISPNEIRTKFQTREEIESWIHDLEEMTKNTWYITRTIITPVEKARKHIFKRIYHCHFRTKVNKLKTARRREHTSRNMDCPALLYVTIKKQEFNSRTKSKPADALLKKWPCVISFKNTHNHTEKSVEALVKRRIGEETKQEILQMFDDGHSVATAYKMFCTTKIEQFGEKYDELVCDRHYFPSKADFSNLWKKHQSDESMFLQLKESLKDRTEYKITGTEEDYAVSICTPIMQRAATHLSPSLEIIFVDATVNCDVQNHRLYLFSAQSPAGSVPLGLIITNSAKPNLFDKAVKDLIEIMAVKISPSVIMTADSLTERNILQKYWPKSKLLLCTFHVLSAVWRWLQLNENGIKKEERPSLYRLFRNILMSKNKVNMEKHMEVFRRCYKYPHFKNYVDGHIEQIHAWCMHFRKSIDDDIVMFRLLQDISLEQTKAYNLTQLTDFIVTSFESCYKQRLLDLVVGQISEMTINRDDESVLTGEIRDLGDMQYHVEGSCDKTVYFVDMNCSACSCPVGITGKQCKHQSAIRKQLNLTNPCDALSLESRKILYIVATGSDPPENILLRLLLSERTTENIIIKVEREMDDDDESVHSLVVEPSISCIETENEDIRNDWFEFISKFQEDVMRNLEDDPIEFGPAIEEFLKNYRENINSSAALLSGLHSAFKRPKLQENGKN